MGIEDRILSLRNIRDVRRTFPRNPNGRKFGKRNPEEIRGVVFHQALSHASLEDVARYHTGPNHISQDGLEGISYTFGIDFDGQLYLFHDLDVKVWSQGDPNKPGDENRLYVSVVLQGAFRFGNEGEYLGVTLGEPTKRQIKAIYDTIALLALVLPITAKDVYGHFDFGKPSCPGNTVEQLIKAFRSQYSFEEKSERRRFLREWGGDIRAFQQYYNENVVTSLYYEEDRLATDGVWGPKTERAAWKYLTL